VPLAHTPCPCLCLCLCLWKGGGGRGVEGRWCGCPAHTGPAAHEVHSSAESTLLWASQRSCLGELRLKLARERGECVVHLPSPHVSIPHSAHPSPLPSPIPHSGYQG